MFEVGFTELLLIFALALLVLGPQKLPKLAQQVGRWVGRARSMARQFREQLEEEAHSLETKMTVDPDIDTSLDSRRDAPVSPSAAAPGTVIPVPPPTYQDVDEQFYPPDHHMHPAHHTDGATPDAAAETPHDAADSSRQGEFDLTNNPEPPKGP